MEKPMLPKNELQRLASLNEYALLDSLPEEDYDNITHLVTKICEVPVALITMLSEKRNYFKSRQGVPFQESPRNISFCGHAILSDEPIFVIEDARLDARFIENPLIKEANAVFYAGVPLINPDGFALGTLCVFDHRPKKLTELQKEALIILGKQVVNLFELRRKNLKLEAARSVLAQHNLELGKFASHVSHDLKSPLANIVSLTHLLKEDLNEQLSSESLEYFDNIEESALILRDYIDGILLHYKADELLLAKKQDVRLSIISEEIKQLLLAKNDTLNYYGEDLIKNINRPALIQILINLVDNALKYNDQEKRIVEISYSDEPYYHKFSVSDNGIGIDENKKDLIFNLFETIPKENGKPTTGIGLSTIKNLVSKLGGDIKVTSELGIGSIFTFTIAR